LKLYVYSERFISCWLFDRLQIIEGLGDTSEKLYGILRAFETTLDVPSLVKAAVMIILQPVDNVFVSALFHKNTSLVPCSPQPTLSRSAVAPNFAWSDVLI
jgi:hypothetical protein